MLDSKLSIILFIFVNSNKFVQDEYVILFASYFLNIFQSSVYMLQLP